MSKMQDSGVKIVTSIAQSCHLMYLFSTEFPVKKNSIS